MKTLTIVFVILTTLNLTIFGQTNPILNYNYCYGGSEDDFPAYSFGYDINIPTILQTSDGGTIIIGESKSSDGDIPVNYGESDVMLIKLDSLSNIHWVKNYGGTKNDGGLNIIQLPDSGYIFNAVTYSNDYDVSFNHDPVGTYADAWIVRIDKNGNIIWENTFGGHFDDAMSQIIADTSGILLYGGTASNDGDIINFHGTPGFTSDILLFKMDYNGNVLWKNCYGGSQTELPGKINTFNNSEFIVSSFTNSNDGDASGFHGTPGDFYKFDILVSRLSSEGIVLWNKCLGGTNNETFKETIVSEENTLITAATTTSNDGDIEGNHGMSDFWIVTQDSLGNILSTECYGGSFEDSPTKLILKDGNIVAIGHSRSEDGDVIGHHGGTTRADVWVFQTDNLGNILWQNSLGGICDDIGKNIFNTNEDGFLLYCTTTSNDGDVVGWNDDGLDCGVITPNKDIWIVKVDSIGNLQWQKCIGGTSDDEGGDIILLNNGKYVGAGYVFSYDGDAIDHHGDPAGDPYSPDIFVFELAFKYYQDLDNDSYGDSSYSIIAGEVVPDGYVANDDDCNDLNPDIKPDYDEVCNQIDDNCDGEIDEGLSFTTYFFDNDSDGFGNSAIDSVWCAYVVDYVLDSTDCDDTNPDIYPGAVELLNLIDDNCDLIIDDGLAVSAFQILQYQIYPNPATRNITIELNHTGELDAILIQLYNVSLDLIYSASLNSIITEIDVSDFAKGIYLLKLSNCDELQWHKIVIQ